jgi:hypothetical protein
MANFTPIATGAAANASVVNAPLYQLDAAITSLQSVGSISATRPWAVIGGTAQPTSSDNVPVTANITHTGKMVRGQLTITSTGADMETIGNLAVGGGHHVFTSTNACAIGDQHTVGGYALAVGQQNTVTGDSLAVGQFNVANAQQSLVVGVSCEIGAGSTGSVVFGYGNIILNNSTFATIGGGASNQIVESNYAFVGAGNSNFIQGTSTYGAIVAGLSNGMFAGAASSVIVAGNSNRISNRQSFIGAGESNFVQSADAAIVAGHSNTVYGTNTGILAGQNNTVTLQANGIDPLGSILAGGINNKIWDSKYSFMGAGNTNFVNFSDTSAIVAGTNNTIGPGAHHFVGAGTRNTITNGQCCFIGAGDLNVIDGLSTLHSAIVGGLNNHISGSQSTVVGGNSNVISGTGSVGGGVAATIAHDWAFLWNSNFNSDFNSIAHGEFSATAYGGVRLFTNLARSTGMTMAAGASSWTAVSARALKGEFNDVQPLSILDRLLTVPIQTWRFKNGSGYHEHINLGPVAEDWDGAFADLLGKKTIAVTETETLPAINEGDKLGVALAAIQGLAALVYDLREEVLRTSVLSAELIQRTDLLSTQDSLLSTALKA